MGIRWKGPARALRIEAEALLLAARHPRTPKRAKGLILALAAYALSPIDLIPDFIPILGHLDDVIIVGLGVWLAKRMIPLEVLEECRALALAKFLDGKPPDITAGPRL